MKGERWNVSVWLEGERRPLSSKDYPEEGAAVVEEYRVLAVINREGWPLKVTRSFVIEQR